MIINPPNELKDGTLYKELEQFEANYASVVMNYLRFINVLPFCCPFVARMYDTYRVG